MPQIIKKLAATVAKSMTTSKKPINTTVNTSNPKVVGWVIRVFKNHLIKQGPLQKNEH